MRPARALVVAAAALILSGSAWACAPPEEEEIADVCHDLRSLGATFDLLIRPPVDATVGQLRGAVEKVAPTLGRASDVDATDEALDDAIDGAVETFRDGLEDLGDDEPARLAEPALADARPRMLHVVDAVSTSLACPA